MENKTSKYLKYAIGEIVLVVIGILIALQVNNYNIDRINQQKANDLLLELKEEYVGKLDELNQKVQLRNMMISSSGSLLKHIKEQDHSISQDSLIALTALTTLTPTFDASNSVTEELMNTGSLYLINNKDLRKLVIQWTGELDKLIEEEDRVIEVMMNNYMPYLSSRIPYNSIATTFLAENSEVWQYISKTTNRDDLLTYKSNKNIEIQTLFQDMQFESYLATIYFGCILANMQSANLKSYINSVIELIESELTNN